MPAADGTVNAKVTADVSDLKAKMGEAEAAVKKAAEAMAASQVSMRQAANELSLGFRKFSDDARNGGEQAQAVLRVLQERYNESKEAAKSAAAGYAEAAAALEELRTAASNDAAAQNEDANSTNRNSQAKGRLVADSYAATAATRLMRGEIGNNVRAVERFMISTLGLGPVLQAAFPIIGAVSMAAMLGDLAKKVVSLTYDFITLRKETDAAWKGIAQYAKEGTHATDEYLRQQRENAVLQAELNGPKAGRSARGRAAGDAIDLKDYNNNLSTANSELARLTAQREADQRRLAAAQQKMAGTGRVTSSGMAMVGDEILNAKDAIEANREEKRAENELAADNTRIASILDKKRELEAKIQGTKLASTLATREENEAGSHDANKAREEQYRQWEIELAQMKARGTVAATVERDFWQARIHAAQKGSSQYLDILNRIASLSKEIDSASAEAKTRGSRSTSLENIENNGVAKAGEQQLAAAERVSDQKVRLEQRAADRSLDIMRAEALEADRLAQKKLKAEQKYLQSILAAGLITKEQFEAQMASIEQTAYKVRASAIGNATTIDAYGASLQGPDGKPALNREHQQTEDSSLSDTLEQGHADTVNQERMQPILDMSTKLERNFSKMSESWTSCMDDMLRGTRTVGQAFATMGDQMALSIINNITKASMEYVARTLIMHLAHAEMNQANVVSDQTSATESKAISQENAMTQMFHWASVAAAKTWASVSDIPVIGPALAPEAAAAAYAGVLALAAFQSGTDYVPRTGIAMLHEGEAVLNNRAADQYRSGGMNGSQGGTTNHFHFSPQISGPDHAGMAKKMYPHFQRMVQSAHRNSNH